MGKRKITVGLDATTQPDGRFGICAEQQLGEADKKHPPGGKGIARREPKRLVNIGLGFLGVAEKILAKPIQP